MPGTTENILHWWSNAVSLWWLTELIQGAYLIIENANILMAPRGARDVRCPECRCRLRRMQTVTRSPKAATNLNNVVGFQRILNKT